MLSSVKFGVRPRISFIFSNSEGSTPRSSAVCTVVNWSVVALLISDFYPLNRAAKVANHNRRLFLSYQHRNHLHLASCIM